MLQAVTGDASVDAHLGVVVTRYTLPLRIGPFPVLPETGIPPQGVPGPTWVNSSSSVGRSR